MPQGLTAIREVGPPPPAAAVAEAQRRLAGMELYQGPITGDLTPAVRVALAQYQRTRSLEVTGLLDEATATALGLGALADWPEAGDGRPEDAAPTGPSAAEILEQAELPELPQPPPGALAEARAAAAALLASGTAKADGAVAEALRRLPGEALANGAGEGDEVRAAQEDAGAAEATGTDLRGAEEAADRAQGSLGAARREAFALLLEARRDGGWALLPPEILARLENELQQRSLLLRGPDRKLGPDDEAAIRWVQRSNGLEPTGVPTLQLLEVLGIDPSPMFELP